MTTYVILRKDPIRGGSTVKLHALDTLLALFAEIHGVKARTGDFTSVISVPAGQCDIKALISDVFGKVPVIGASGDAEAMANAKKQAELLIASSGGIAGARRRLNGGVLEYFMNDMYIEFDRLVR